MNELEIIKEKIRSEMTGHAGHDIPYLQSMSYEYRNHPLRDEILKYCQELMGSDESVQPDSSVSLNINSRSVEKFDDEMEKLNFYIQKDELDRALDLADQMVIDLEDEEILDEEHYEYHTFYDFFQETLYRHRFKPQKELRQADIPYSEIYYRHAYLLLKKQRFEKAEEALERALKWNPIEAKIHFLYAELFRQTGDTEKFLSVLRETYNNAYSLYDLSKIFSGLGYYLTEKEEYLQAKACYKLSLKYDDENEQAAEALKHLKEATDGLPDPTDEETADIVRVYGFETGASSDVIKLATDYGMALKDKKDYEGARELLEIADELQPDKKIEEVLDALPVT